MMTEVILSADDRQRVQRYHAVLATGLGLGDLARINARFRANHKIADGEPIIPALDAVLAAHRRRVEGVGSPAECDEVAKKVTS